MSGGCFMGLLPGERDWSIRMKATTALISNVQQNTIVGMEAHANLENDISATPNVQVSRDIITPNGCHLTLVFPKEGRKGVREEIAEILLSTIMDMEG